MSIESPPMPRDFLAPWLTVARQYVARAMRDDKLTHAFLIQGQTGLGQRVLAESIGQLVLCEGLGVDDSHACGSCASCVLYLSGGHPDVHRVGLVEEKKQIAVDDVRKLSAELQMKSYRGGAKVGIIDPADAMNLNGMNALLKTLEEPSRHTLLILTCARLDRFPATIASRCQRIKLRVPTRQVARSWLSALDPNVAWDSLLDLSSGAPFAARELAAAGALEIDAQMATVPELLARPNADLVELAERCQGSFPAERFRWLELWVSDRIRKLFVTPSAGSGTNSPVLSAARRRHLQGLYSVLDMLKVSQGALRGSANVTLLWEQVLGSLSRELLRARPVRGR